jgi:hypothetical protein
LKKTLNQKLINKLFLRTPKDNMRIFLFFAFVVSSIHGASNNTDMRSVLRKLNNAALNQQEAARKQAAADAFNLANPCRSEQGINISVYTSNASNITNTIYNISFTGGATYTTWYEVPFNSTNSTFYRTCPPSGPTSWCNSWQTCAMGVVIVGVVAAFFVSLWIGSCVVGCIRKC